MINPYESLANGIIEQAVKDHRSAAKYLKKNPPIKELRETVARYRAAREKARKKRMKKKLPPKKVRYTKAERLLDRVIAHQRVIDDTEGFILSGWFATLTDLDGVLFLGRLKEMEAASDEHKRVSGTGNVSGCRH